jgi:hypothetical protein
LQQASAVFVISTAAHMPTDLIDPVLALCRALTSERGPYAQALLHAAEAEAAHFSGRFLSAETAFERAERLLVEHCVGATRELSTVRNGAAFMQYAHKGDFKTNVGRTLGWLADAEAREDLFHAAVLRVSHAIVWVGHDEPDRARRELLRAESDWSDADGLFEVVAVLYHDIVDRYLGDDSLPMLPLQGRAHVLNSPSIQSSFLSGYVELHRAWGNLRELARGHVSAGEEARVETAIAAMHALGTDIWEAMAAAFEANLLFLRQKTEVALDALERSEHAFRRSNMLCLAASVRRRRGELAGGSFGTELVHDAERELRALGVVQPAKWCAAYFSMYPAELTLDKTLLTAVD